MTDDFMCVELSKIENIEAALCEFDCGHPDFNEYLMYDAKIAAANGEGVTYLLVFRDEFESGIIESIPAFVTVSTMALFYNKDEEVHSVPAVEIKYFAISKKLQKATKYFGNQYKFYSTILLENFLSELYSMSIETVGFQAIFLRANENGEKLYRRKFFVDADDFIIPYSEDDPLEQCKPLVLFIQDNLYSVFGEEQSYGSY